MLQMRICCTVAFVAVIITLSRDWRKAVGMKGRAIVTILLIRRDQYFTDILHVCADRKVGVQIRLSELL